MPPSCTPDYIMLLLLGTTALATMFTFFLKVYEHYMSRLNEQFFMTSRMGVQLRLAAVALHRLAIITKEPGDIEAAQLAQMQYDEHIAQQAVMDARK
jgi:hypothetical protein